MRKRWVSLMAGLLFGTTVAAYAGLASIPVGNVIARLVESALLSCGGTKLPTPYCAQLIAPLVLDTIRSEVR